MIDAAEHFDKLLIRLVMDIYETEVIILPISAPSMGMILILEPMHSDDLGLPSEAFGCYLGAAQAFVLSFHRHQVAIVAVARAIFVGGKKPFGDEERFVTRQSTETVEEVAGQPAIGAVNIIVGRDDIDIWKHRLHGDRIVIDWEAIAQDQRIGVCFAQSVMGQSIIMASDNLRPLSYNLNSLAAGSQ